LKNEINDEFKRMPILGLKGVYLAGRNGSKMERTLQQIRREKDNAVNAVYTRPSIFNPLRDIVIEHTIGSNAHQAA
jgi:hypothetical protein